jgi:polyhydroxybutyrate depolymerase
MWRKFDDCTSPTVTTSGVVTKPIAACPDGRAIELITIAGAGHQWPGGVNRPVVQRILQTGPPSTALNATDTIWKFFAAHPKPAST